MQKGHVMSLSLSFPEDLDPKAPLSKEDLVRVLTWYCHDICNKVVNENLKLERELCNDKIKKVIEGFKIIAGISTIHMLS